MWQSKISSSRLGQEESSREFRVSHRIDPLGRVNSPGSRSAGLELITRILTVTVLALATSACATGTSTLFRATFDSDAPHSAPAQSPPGPPDSDFIYWFNTDRDAPFVTVVNDGALASNSIRIANLRSSRGHRFVAFIPVPASPSADSLYAYWNGVVYISETPLHIWLGWTQSEPLIEILLHNGDVRLRNGTGDYENVGSFQHGESHLILFALNRRDNTIDFSFVQRNNIISRQDLEPASARALDDTRPALGIGYFEMAESNAFYVADNIVISETAPPMP